MNNEEKSNYSTILKVTKVIGSSTLISMILNMVRMKVAAVFLGPAGVGFIGLLQSFVLLVSSIIGAGLNQSAIRQVAQVAVSDDEKKKASTQNAVNSLSAILVIAGTTLLFYFRDLIEPYIAVSDQYVFGYSWIVLCIALVTLSGIFTAQLNGYRKIKELALINVLSAFFSLTLGSLGLYFSDAYGFLIFFVSFFLLRFLFASFFLKTIYLNSYDFSNLKSLAIEYQPLLKLGFAMMIGALAWNFAHLFVKKLIEEDIGLSEVGVFEAGWTLGTVYLGFLLASIGADYLPRLTAACEDPKTFNDIINHQTEVIFLFAGPIVILTVGLAPWIVVLAYSPEFSRSSDLLRLFIVGDTLKLLTWPLTYAIIASGYSRYFLFVELTSVFFYCFVIFLFLDYLGASSAGLSIIFIYLAALPLCYFKLRKNFAFKWSTFSIKLFTVIFCTTLLVFLIGEFSPVYAALSSVALSIIIAIYSFLSFCKRTGRPHRLQRFTRQKL